MFQDVIILAACLGALCCGATIGALNISRLSGGLEQLLRRLGERPARTTRRWPWLAATALGAVAMLKMRLYAAAALPTAVLAASWLAERAARARRLRLFEEQFEQAATTMANSLRAGQSLAQAMAAVEREYGPPLGTEFRQALQEYRAGLPLIEAIDGIRRRVPCPEAAFFVRALAIHGATGGNVAGVLTNVSRVIRQRRLLRGEVAAKSGEARLTAAVLAILPGVLSGYLLIVNRDMLAPLLTTALGRVGLVYAILSWLVGVVVINRLAASVGGS